MRIYMHMRTVRLALIALLLVSAGFAQQKIPLNPKLYDPAADARKEIAEALKESARWHKRILLVFGGNWCLDCQVLDYRFHQEPEKSIIDSSYKVIHVDIGHADKNLDLASEYHVPINKGVPGIAVLDSDGKLLYSQENGEFESARSLDPQQIVAFLEKWKPNAVSSK